MVYGYQLKDKTEKKGKVFDGLVVKPVWQFTSDAKVAATLRKWAEKVTVIEADDIQSVKAKTNAQDSSKKEEIPSEEEKDTDITADNPLVKELSQKTLFDIKDFAKANGFDETEYNAFNREKLIEYIVLGMAARENA